MPPHRAGLWPVGGLTLADLRRLLTRMTVTIICDCLTSRMKPAESGQIFTKRLERVVRAIDSEVRGLHVLRPRRSLHAAIVFLGRPQPPWRLPIFELRPCRAQAAQNMRMLSPKRPVTGNRYTTLQLVQVKPTKSAQVVLKRARRGKEGRLKFDLRLVDVDARISLRGEEILEMIALWHAAATIAASLSFSVVYIPRQQRV